MLEVSCLDYSKFCQKNRRVLFRQVGADFVDYSE